MTEEQIIFTVVENQKTKRPVIMIGITRDAWAVIKRGGFQELDLTQCGLTGVTLEVHGGLTHEKVKETMRRGGLKFMDIRKEFVQTDPPSSPAAVSGSIIKGTSDE